MIHYAVLGSGSNGNSYAVSDGRQTVLIDQGFSLAGLKRRLEAFGMPFSSVIGCCVTHLHPDHVLGLGTFARRSALPVWVNRAAPVKEPVVWARLNIPQPCVRLVDPGTAFTAGPFTLVCFPTSHDSGGSVGWVVRVGGSQLMVLTDTGETTEEERAYASRSDVLFLEANYDEDLLENGPYPRALKNRIKGRWGHLSNLDAIRFLEESPFRGRRVYFVHLSATNNHPGLLASQASGLYRGPFTVCERGKGYEGTITP